MMVQHIGVTLINPATRKSLFRCQMTPLLTYGLKNTRVFPVPVGMHARDCHRAPFF